MAVIKMKPTSPGQRAMVKVSRDHLHKGEAFAGLLEPQFQKAGRNNNGHITTRHKGGGHKHHYRVVDFRRNKDAIPAKVERIEYDPNRSAHIALVCYADGERRYIIAPRNLKNVFVVEPRYADPVSLIQFKKVLVTKGAIDKLKEMFA